MYICSPDQTRSFISITEIKSCVYEAIVAVKELCSHPVFKKEEPIEHEIQCFASNDVANPVPKSMLRFQNELKARPMLPLKSDRGPLTQRIPSQFANNDVMDLFKNPETLKHLKELKSIFDSVKKSTKPESKESRLTEFWNGKACLYGGTGYWQYEFCYNRQVSQFHEEPDGKVTRINLGYYNADMHKEWISESGVESRKIENGRVKQISVMYTGGDICSEANTLRRCEVRMKCRPVVEGDKDPDAINMFLVEPDTCSYVLLVSKYLNVLYMNLIHF